MRHKDEVPLEWRENANRRIDREYNIAEQSSLEYANHQTSFNGKVFAKMILDNRLVLGNFADKLCSSNVMSEFLPTGFLPNRDNILVNANDLNEVDLPEEFFLKVNHGSGGLIGVTSRADKDQFLPEVGSAGKWPRLLIHPERFDKELAIQHLNSWLNTKYRQEPNYIREWCYSLIEPKMFVEKLYRDLNITPPQLNILCFHGSALAFIYSDRRSDMKSFVRYIFFKNEENFARICSKLSIDQWQTMIKASEAVSQYTDMVRVDWILANKGPIFSELTNYPYGGGMKFNSTSTRTSQEVDKTLSDYWGSIGPY
jgi:hypothetical protein